MRCTSLAVGLWCMGADVTQVSQACHWWQHGGCHCSSSSRLEVAVYHWWHQCLVSAAGNVLLPVALFAICC